ncbi:MAG: tetratricopeptide repeat protein [Methanocellales archaeon]|nr:tetratricopeptide repeat protein [Methanocellales archaeon]
MVRKSGRHQKTAEVETNSEPQTVSTLSSEGEFPCVLVFPDKQYVKNYTFAPVFDSIKKTLAEMKFQLKLLSSESRDLARYMDEFVKIAANECVYGVVILDGFRPNVLLELGILMGLNKPITILKSKDAEISVKALYQSQSESGLTPKQFECLRNPKIRLGTSNHLSDLSTHLTIFDPSVYSDDPNHVSKKLEGSIKRISSSIVKESEKVYSRSIAEIMPNYLQEYQETLLNLLQYYTRSTEFNVTDIDRSRQEIKNLEEKSRCRVPSDTHSIIASLYVSLSEKASWSKVQEITKHLGTALDIYNEALRYESSHLKKADIQKKSGDIYWKLAQYSDKNENCKKAIKAYNEALKVRTLERFPMQYATTQNNLGAAYQTLAEVEAKTENCKKAIKACEEALKVRTLERFPMDYAMTQNNLGNAYKTLAEVEAKTENCKKAIKAYNEALKVYTLERFPMDYAMTQNNLGAAYQTLAEVEAKTENCKKAINAYEEALKVFNKEAFPEIYPLVERNLRGLINFCEGA